MDTRKVKDSLNRLLRYLPVRMPTTGWSFAHKAPACVVSPENRTWTCMFGYINRIVRGEPVCFSSENTGCSGASCYLGFKTPSKDAGSFLAQKEKFKKDAALGNAFYEHIGAHASETKFIIWGTIDNSDEDAEIEVVNLWVDAVNLAGLVTLSNYDRPNNDNVSVPFASGCQSIWTIPYKEKHAEESKGIVGCMDPAMRKYLPSDVVSFSVPTKRFVEMTENISGSFLEQSGWKNLMDEKVHSSGRARRNPT
ncbi:MAG: DUF169 domain-containing protein [Nitrospirae bacterium]|nr:DUF169 domain-containing protein [Nitrospirota bacterium]